MTDGNILYVSESVTSLLEHLPVSHARLALCCLKWIGPDVGKKMMVLQYVHAFYVKPNLTLAACFCLCLCQTDLVDQNLLNFLPIGEHSDVYKALSTHPNDPESLNTDFMKSKTFILTHRPHELLILRSQSSVL